VRQRPRDGTTRQTLERLVGRRRGQPPARMQAILAFRLTQSDRHDQTATPAAARRCGARPRPARARARRGSRRRRSRSDRRDPTDVIRPTRSDRRDPTDAIRPTRSDWRDPTGSVRLTRWNSRDGTDLTDAIRPVRQRPRDWCDATDAGTAHPAAGRWAAGADAAERRPALAHDWARPLAWSGRTGWPSGSRASEQANRPRTWPTAAIGPGASRPAW
jgi:hypothetical protein